MRSILKRPIFFCFFNSLAFFEEEEIKLLGKSISRWNYGKMFSLFTPKESELYRIYVQTKASAFLKSSPLMSVRQCVSLKEEIENIVEKIFQHNTEKKSNDEDKKKYEYVPFFLAFSDEDIKNFKFLDIPIIFINQKSISVEQKDFITKEFSSIKEFVASFCV